VTGPVARYTSSARYYWISSIALAGAGLVAWIALRLPAVSFVSALLIFLSVAIFGVARLPPIEIRETSLVVGRRVVAWNEIRRIDQTHWTVPLAVYLTLSDGTRMLLIHAGGHESSTSLLRHLRRYARHALLDGIPYRQFWGETASESHGSSSQSAPSQAPSSQAAPSSTASSQAPSQAATSKVRLLRVEDEEEVERMFQRLKSVGRLDARDARDTRGSDES
jgi:hypothetical protein